MNRIQKTNRNKCILTLAFSAAVVICVCVGVVMNLTTLEDENFDHMGLRTFCMFTVNSNILAAGAMAMVIPYTMDGLRTHNYYLPRWIVDLVYAGVTAVALTFIVSLFILAPVKGFVLKEKTIEEMAADKERSRALASAAAKERQPRHRISANAAARMRFIVFTS